MYKHGRPVHKLTRKPLAVAGLLLIAALAAGYFLVVKPNIKNTLSNSNQARVTVIKSTKPGDTQIDEPIFSGTLPGDWKLSSVDNDARYHSYQWSGTSKTTNGRWFKVFVDTIPKDQAVNYLLPVTVQNNAMSLGQVSDNCIDFTEGATPEDQRPANISLDQASLLSRWQLVNFLCDNANVDHQVVGAASTAGINTITLSGPKSGTHNFFFMYQDNDISPDFGQFETILSNFKVK